MAERTDRQAQIDPWDSVHEGFADMSQWETARVYRADAVDAARAADAALLRERDAQIASLTAQVEQQEQELAENAAHLRRMLSNRYDADNATLRAERDAAQQENTELRQARDEANAVIARYGFNGAKLQVERLEQENQTLREALQAAWCELIQHDDQPWVKTLAGQVRVVGLFAFPRPQESQP